jgi:hypothetical protein
MIVVFPRPLGMNDHAIQRKVPTFVIMGHCFVHKTNLVVITFLDVPLEHQLESVLQRLYAYLPITQRNMLVNFLNTKCNKLLRNLKIHWISRMSMIQMCQSQIICYYSWNKLM